MSSVSMKDLKKEVTTLENAIRKTYEDIRKANETIKTTDVKGKDYAEVNQRIKAFRMVHPNGTITTDIISLEGGVVTMKSTVSDEEGKVIGTGLAQEIENSSFINKTSFIENCETSAVGRALGMCGFGIDVSVASYEEVANAIENQNKQQSKQQEKQPVQKKEPPKPKAKPKTQEPKVNLNEEIQKRAVKLGELGVDFASKGAIDFIKKYNNGKTDVNKMSDDEKKNYILVLDEMIKRKS